MVLGYWYQVWLPVLDFLRSGQRLLSFRVVFLSLHFIGCGSTDVQGPLCSLDVELKCAIQISFKLGFCSLRIRSLEKYNLMRTLCYEIVRLYLGFLHCTLPRLHGTTNGWEY